MARDAPLITLTTDFGTSDPYVAVMKGVILGISPRASILDISHHIRPQSVLEGAFIIGSSHRYFPPDTVHVAVVDPGVGTSRNAVLLTTPSARFLAPDNGVLSYILEEGFRQRAEIPEGPEVAVPQGYMAYRLTNPEFWLHPVSSTFHGRDIFAPVAAHLSLGVPPHRFGPEVGRLVWLPAQQPRRDDAAVAGEVIHVDRFGNLITNIPAELLTRHGPIAPITIIEVKGHRIAGLSTSYAEGEWLLAIVGSNGTLEVSVKNGSASDALGAGVGEAVTVHTPR